MAYDFVQIAWFGKRAKRRMTEIAAKCPPPIPPPLHHLLGFVAFAARSPDVPATNFRPIRVSYVSSLSYNTIE